MDIRIDHAKCTAPEKCGRCLRVCSPQVFALHPREADAVIPDEWVVSPVWISFCIQCNLCVEACPVHAISLVE